VREGDSVLVSEADVGRGTMVFVADPSPFENSRIADADNAAVVVALAGDDGRPVFFAEGVHDYGASRGWRALPTSWKLALFGILLAALAFVWSRARRLGPPDRTARELAPPRAEYVDALAATLERTRDPGVALGTVQRHVREQVAARSGLRPDATDEDVDRAAAALGYSEAERHALLVPPATADDVVRLGRLATRSTRTDGGTE
jgi:hypothetical protein